MSNKLIISAVVAMLPLTLSGCTISGNPDGGVYRSTDTGFSFEQKAKIDDKHDIANDNILSLELDPINPDTIYVGTKEDGILRSSNAGENWVKDVNKFTSVTAIAIDPTTPSTLYIAAVKDKRGKILKQTNANEGWQEMLTQKTNGPLFLSLAIDKANPNILYAGDSLGGIYKSTDAGKTWTSILWAKSSVRDIAIDNANTQVVYFGTTRSGVLLTKDGGQTFSSIVKSGYIYNVETHPIREGGIFLSNKDGIAVSFDYGSNWEIINTLVKPKDLSSRALAIDPNNDNIIYYTSGKAFYKSINRGSSWATVQFNVSKGLDIIKINPKDTSKIYLGMNRRSTGFSLLPSSSSR